jgi:hypothetical protein
MGVLLSPCALTRLSRGAPQKEMYAVSPELRAGCGNKQAIEQPSPQVNAKAEPKEGEQASEGSLVRI